MTLLPYFILNEDWIKQPWHSFCTGNWKADKANNFPTPGKDWEGHWSHLSIYLESTWTSSNKNLWRRIQWVSTWISENPETKNKGIRFICLNNPLLLSLVIE